MPFNKYAFLTTHNSFAISEGRHSGLFSLVITNQDDKITQQLNVSLFNLMIAYLKINNLLIFVKLAGPNFSFFFSLLNLQHGVRALMLDTYDYKNDIWLCHASKGKCEDYTSFVSYDQYIS